MRVRTKRIYEDPRDGDGYRVLVDRQWPRGVSRERAQLDEWQAELAPSRDLRVWFSHQPERYEGFRDSYIEELRERRPQLTALRARAREGTVTLLYAARDRQRNNATVLAEVLRRGLPARSSPAAGRHHPGAASR